MHQLLVDVKEQELGEWKAELSKIVGEQSYNHLICGVEIFIAVYIYIHIYIHTYTYIHIYIYI